MDTTSFLLIICLLLSGALDAYKVEVENLEKIPMYSRMTAKLRMSFTGEERKTFNRDDVVTVKANISNMDPSRGDTWAVEIINKSFVFTYDDIKLSRAKQLVLEGKIIGVEKLNLFIDSNLTSSSTVYVIVNEATLNDIFTLILIIMVVVNTVNMGAQLDLEIVKAVLKKPIGPMVGFVSQFVFMPLFSFFVGWLMSSDPMFRLGLFVLGCCPGGTGSNFWTLLLDGDINLSITMTFFSTILALGMMPLWIFLMGPLLSDAVTEGDLVIPFTDLIVSLFMLILPVALGMWIRWRWVKAAKFMEKIIVPFTLLTVIFVFTAGVYINLFIFQLITGKMVGAGFVVAISGYLFGAGLSWMFRLNWAQITAVSVETAFQNGNIAFVLLKLSFKNNEPYGELSALAPVAQLLVTGSPLWVLLGIWKLYQKCIKKKTVKDEPIKYSQVTKINVDSVD